MLRNLNVALWLILVAVWFLAAMNSKATARKELSRGRIAYGILLLVGCDLLIQPWRLGPLNVRFVPDTQTVGYLGLALTAAGVAFAIWARFTLGRNWSGTVTIKEDHELIQRGPYRLVRHPIYTGILLAMMGTAVGYGRVPCLIGVAIAFFSLRFKWATEERFMTEQFGDKYTQYRRDVKAVIPGIL